MHAEAALNQAAGFSTGVARGHVPLYWEDISILRMELKSVRLEIPENGNIIVGQSHFIKTVEDLYEAIVNTAPQMKFGIAFNEASGACLIRVDGNDRELERNAANNAQALAAGHVFVIAMRDGYPINVLGRIREIPKFAPFSVPPRMRSRLSWLRLSRGAESWAWSTAVRPRGSRPRPMPSGGTGCSAKSVISDKSGENPLKEGIFPLTPW
jgi:hypothetical protein